MTEQEATFLTLFYDQMGGRTDQRQGVLARKIGTGEDIGNIALAGSLADQKYLQSDSSYAHEEWYLSRKGKEWVEGRR
jgi:hypothetical protein